MKTLDLADFEAQAVMLKVLAHRTRLEILFLLEHHPKLSVSEIKEMLGCDQTYVSQHLKQLRLRGILGSKRSGKFIFYYLKEKSCGELTKIFEKMKIDKTITG